jgi:hypothetical protein
MMNRGYDLRYFNQMYSFFSSIQVVQHRRYCFLFNGRMAVQIVTELIERQGFRFDVFQSYYYDCLRRGMPQQMAIQQAFYRMNVRVNVTNYLL